MKKYFISSAIILVVLVSIIIFTGFAKATNNSDSGNWWQYNPFASVIKALFGNIYADTSDGVNLYVVTPNSNSTIYPSQGYRLDILSSTTFANQPVTICTVVAPIANGSAGTCTPAQNLGFPATTNSYGQWTAEGNFSVDPKNIGNWVEYVRVGSTSSNQISFSVVPFPTPPIPHFQIISAASSANLNKLGINGFACIAALGPDSKGYPVSFNGQPVSFDFEITAGNGKKISAFATTGQPGEHSWSQAAYDQIATMMQTDSKLKWDAIRCIDVKYNIREKTPCSPGTSCDANSMWGNPLIPGQATLSKVTASVKDEYSIARTGAILSSATYGLNLPLFTVGTPPHLQSSSKSTVKLNETTEITGTNFDTSSSLYNRFSNVFFVDMDPSTINNQLDTPGKYSRIINYQLSDDFIHYCSPTRIKLDFPPDRNGINGSTTLTGSMPAGQHTLILKNEFGYSNAISLSSEAAAGTPENDTSCAHPLGSITSISPTSGPVGTVVTINGNGLLAPEPLGLNGEISIFFNKTQIVNTRTQLGVNYWSPNQYKIKVPAGATTGPIIIYPNGSDAIWGPVFTVTPGLATDLPEPSGTSTTLSVSAIFPETINSQSDNYILITGKNLTTDTKLTSTNSALSFSDIAIGNDGKTLRAKVRVGNTTTTTATIDLSSINGDDSVSVKITPWVNGLPQISNLVLSALDEHNRATLTVLGSNLKDATMKIVGGQVVVLSSETSDTSIIAQLEFSMFYSTESKEFFFVSLINSVSAALIPTNPAILVLANTKGNVSTAFDAPKIANTAATNNGTSSPVSYNYTNPLTGNPTSLAGLITIIANFILSLAIPIAVIIIIWGGFLMLTSGGVPAKYQKGINALKYASLGLAVVLIAKGFVSLIQSILNIK
jgi:hypothetical protein